MFRNLTVGKRIGLGFAVVLALLVGVAAVAYRGIWSMGASAAQALEKNELAGELTHKEIDHLNWAKQVGQLLNDPTVLALEVETDPHQCSFGRWLYGDGRRTVENELPQLKPLLKEIEGHHAALHASAIKIGETFREADVAIGSFLREKKADHLAWLHRLKDVFLSDDQTSLVDVEVDPQRCSLGQWLASERVKQLRQRDSAFADAVAAIAAPHAELHVSAKDVGALLAEGQRDAAAARFAETTAPLAEQTLAAIDGALAWHDRAIGGKLAAEQAYVTETLPALAKVQELLQQVAREVADAALAANAETRRAATMTQRFVAIASMAAVVLGLTLAMMIVRGLVRTLRQVIAGLHDGANQVTEASTQVAASSQQLAEGASEQASSLEETSSALEQMAAMTRSNADNSQQADSMAGQAREAADGGGRVVAQLNEAMQGIRSASEQVGKIVKVIQEIAFQTNLLALNAAVEAARAGEHGKGFAVVADEVRNLAQRSAGAADEITDLINNSSAQSQSGVQIAEQVSTALEGILSNINEVSGLISGIAQANGEQAEGVGQVNQAVSQMDRVTQQNAANAEESAAAAEQLSAQAQTVMDMVGRLTAMVEGGGAHAVAASQKVRRSSQRSSAAANRSVALQHDGAAAGRDSLEF